MENNSSEQTELEAAIERWKRFDALADDNKPGSIYAGGEKQFRVETEMMIRLFIAEREARLKQEAEDALPIDEELAASVRSGRVEIRRVEKTGMWFVSVGYADCPPLLQVHGVVETRGQVRMLLAAAGVK